MSRRQAIGDRFSSSIFQDSSMSDPDDDLYELILASDTPFPELTFEEFNYEVGLEGIGDFFTAIWNFIKKIIDGISNFISRLFGGSGSSSSDTKITVKTIDTEKAFISACEEIGKKMANDLKADLDKYSTTIDFSDCTDFKILSKWLMFSDEMLTAATGLKKFTDGYFQNSEIVKLILKISTEKDENKILELLSSFKADAPRFTLSIPELQVFAKIKYKDYGVRPGNKWRFKAHNDYPKGPSDFKFNYSDKQPVSRLAIINELSKQPQIFTTVKEGLLQVSTNLEKLMKIGEPLKQLPEKHKAKCKEILLKCLSENTEILSIFQVIRNVLMYRTKHLRKVSLKFYDASMKISEKLNDESREKIDNKTLSTIIPFDYSGDFNFSHMINDADQLVVRCELLRYSGQEGFFDAVMRLVTGIADMIGRLFRTFKLVYRSFQGLKRTELHDYKEKYAATVMRIKNVNYLEASSLNIPLPKGLNTTYLDVTQKILTCLQLCDMKNRAKSFASTSKNLMDNIQDSKGTSDSVSVLFTQAQEVQKINTAFMQYDKCFDKGSSNQATFGKMFKSIDEFQLEFNLLNDNANYMYDIHSVYKSLKECNDYLQKAVQYATMRKKSGHTATTISKEELTSLSNACLFMAKTFDTYGLSVQDLHRVEHNYIEVMKEIQRKFKL